MNEYVLLSQNATIEDKLRILSDAAKYDVSCSSSGVERRGNGKDMGSSSAPESVILLRQMADVSPF